MQLAQYNMKTAPWKHQLDALKFCENKNAVMLAMDMGTGKSKVAIDLLVARGCKMVLLVCPKVAQYVWEYQFTTHCNIPYRVLVLDGSINDRSDQLPEHKEFPGITVVVTNYEAVWRGNLGHAIYTKHCDAKDGWWDAIILDESHRIKGHSSKQSKYFYKFGKDTRPLKLCLTGTPLPHSPLDVFGQYRFLDPWIFGHSFSAFRARYSILKPQKTKAGQRYEELVGYRWLDELGDRMDKLCYRVKSSECQDLPDQLHTPISINLTPASIPYYLEMKQSFCLWLNDQERVFASHAMVKMLKLQQITGGFVLDSERKEHEIGTEKVDALLGIIEELPEAEPCVVFCRFQHDIKMIRRHLTTAGVTTSEVSGGENTLHEWLSGGTRVLVAQIQSGKESIDLTRARVGIYYSHGLSLGDYEQSLKRIHRPGQKQSVTYYHLLAKGTIDEEIYQSLKEKKSVVDTVLDNMVKRGDTKRKEMVNDDTLNH